MKGYLMFMGCWGTVDGTDSRPTTGDADWVKRDNQAKGLLFMRTHQNFHHLFESKTTAKEMWDALKTKFGKPDGAYVWGLFESIIGEPRMSDQRPIHDQINKLVTRLHEVSSNGITLSANI